MATYNLKIHFELLPSATLSLANFGGYIYSPEKDSEGDYVLIGTWGGSGGDEVVIKRSYGINGSYYLTGYTKCTVSDPLSGPALSDYDYVLLAPSMLNYKVKKYLALPIQYIRLDSDGYADILPAFTDFEKIEEEET